MGWFVPAMIGCQMFCGTAIKALTPLFKTFFIRDVGSDRMAIFYSDAATSLNFTGLNVETNGIVSNTTAVFKFADGYETTGDLTGHSARLPHGIGYGNFTVDDDSGKWITVDLAQGSRDLSEFFQALVEGLQDGNLSPEEISQAIDIIQNER